METYFAQEYTCSHVSKHLELLPTYARVLRSCYTWENTRHKSRKKSLRRALSFLITFLRDAQIKGENRKIVSVTYASNLLSIFPIFYMQSRLKTFLENIDRFLFAGKKNKRNFHQEFDGFIKKQRDTNWNIPETHSMDFFNEIFFIEWKIRGNELFFRIFVTFSWEKVKGGWKKMWKETQKSPKRNSINYHMILWRENQ